MIANCKLTIANFKLGVVTSAQFAICNLQFSFCNFSFTSVHMDALLDKYRVAVAHALDLIVVSDGFGDVAELEAARIRVINQKLLARLGLSAA